MLKTWSTRAVALLLLVFTLFVATFCGCSSNSSNANSSPANAQATFTESGYLIGPAGESCTVNDPYRSFTYTILSDSEYDATKFVSDIDETIDIVRNWWGNDSTFVAPTKIIPVKFSISLRGFAQDSYIFIDPDAEDSMVTVVHETIHLQHGLRDESDNGYAINEMVTEDITKRIMGSKFIGVTTPDQHFFIGCPELVKHRKWLEQSLKEKKTAEETYSPIFGENWVYVTQTLNYWETLPDTLNTAELEVFCNNYLGVTSSQLLQLYEDLSNDG